MYTNKKKTITLKKYFAMLFLEHGMQVGSKDTTVMELSLALNDFCIQIDANFLTPTCIQTEHANTWHMRSLK
jgi:hypothetical protein